MDGGNHGSPAHRAMLRERRQRCAPGDRSGYHGRRFGRGRMAAHAAGHDPPNGVRPHGCPPSSFESRILMSSSPGTRPSSGSILVGIVAVAVVGAAATWVVLNGSHILQSFFPPEPKTVQGHAIHDLYNIVFAIAAVIFFLVEGLIVWSVIRYRRKPGDDELPPQTHGHNLAEVIWTVIPTIIVFFLFFVSWQTLNNVEAHSPKPDLLVKAVAGQFQ